MKSHTKNGFITIIVLIVILLITLGFFGFNLEKIINSTIVHKNLIYIWNLLVIGWNKFIVGTATYLWTKSIDFVSWVIEGVTGWVS